MAYDPYKSLLANATREHVKRSADLNTHLVGNVFLPAIDMQHKKKSSAKTTASMQHLKVIEQCIQAENKREERLAKCATIKERRVLTKKFQVQREHERGLIQALMLGQYPERLQEIKLLETDIVPATTPRQQLNQETTGLTAKIPPPDRVFRKADVTGGVPKAKPHAHKKFKLPQCNGSPGKKGNLRAQAAAAANLSSPSRGKSRETTDSHEKDDAESPSRKKRNPSRSAPSEYSARSSTVQVEVAEEVCPKPKVRSPRISPHRVQLKEARLAPHLSSLLDTSPEPAKPSHLPSADGDEQHSESSSIVFEGAFSFSEAQRLAQGTDTDLLKWKRETDFVEISTQTTPRLVPELPPVISLPLLAAPTRDVSATTPRRPQSGRVLRSTRQSFLENLARENMLVREARSRMIETEVVSYGSICSYAASSEIFAEEKSEEAVEVIKDTPEVLDQPAENAQEEEESGSDDNDDNYTSEAAENDSVVDYDVLTDEELETDVAEVLFELIDVMAAAIEEEEKAMRAATATTRTVSPRPRSSTSQKSKHAIRIQAFFRGYRARIAFRLALYEDALSCGVLGAMPGTIQGRSGWYLDPKRLMAYYFVIPDPDGDWEQKHVVRCSRLVLTPYDMQHEVLSKVSTLTGDEPDDDDEEDNP